ncbi:MAG: hypothetical protein DMF72_12995 [Acidobacteria bacterium]|nr:MAG: hypothetical protein DMF72_12995 [Acidobacteriota bacterium]
MMFPHITNCVWFKTRKDLTTQLTFKSLRIQVGILRKAALIAPKQDKEFLIRSVLEQHSCK